MTCFKVHKDFFLIYQNPKECIVMSCCYQTYGFWKLLMLRILISISASRRKQIYSSPSGFAQNHRRQQLHTDLLDIKSLFISLYLSWGKKKMKWKKKQKERVEISITEKLELRLNFQNELHLKIHSPFLPPTIVCQLIHKQE